MKLVFIWCANWLNKGEAIMKKLIRKRKTVIQSILVSHPQNQYINFEIRLPSNAKKVTGVTITSTLLAIP